MQIMCTSLQFCVRERSKNIFCYQRDVESCMDQVLDFLLFNRHEYIHTDSSSLILVSVFMLQVYVTFSLFFNIWLTELILIFRETCFLLASNTLRRKFFQIKKAAFTEMVLHRLVRRNYGGKLLVGNRYLNLHFFKEGMIHLCQSMLETRRISYLHGSALFTIPLSWPHFDNESRVQERQ